MGRSKFPTLPRQPRFINWIIGLSSVRACDVRIYLLVRSTKLVASRAHLDGESKVDGIGAARCLLSGELCADAVEQIIQCQKSVQAADLFVDAVRAQ